MERRVTQIDIARKASVHQATVSLALKNHPSIPLATRLRIQRLAEELGYQQDPMLSALAVYRQKARKTTFHGTLAWLINSSYDFHWKASPHYNGYYEGSRQAARRHGYQLEEFDIAARDMSPCRIGSILRARNIAGVLLCPQPRPYAELEFPWEDFAALTFGYSLAKPRLHTVVAAFYRHMGMTLQKVRERGYERIGLVLNLTDDQRYDHNILASYLVDAFLTPGAIHMPPLLEDYRRDPLCLKAWLETHKPEVVVSQDWRVMGVLKELGLNVPGDVALACAGIPQDVHDLAGVVEDTLRIGEVAVDFLVSMVQRGERGIPDKAQRILVECDWVEGETLPDAVRPRKKASSAKSRSRRKRVP